MQTKNLRLVAQTPEHLRALMEGAELYEQSSGFRVANGLRELFGSGEVSPEYLARLQDSTEADPWTHGFALVLESGRLVIGMGGFKGPPDADGMVEIVRRRSVVTSRGAACMHPIRRGSTPAFTHCPLRR